MLPNHAPYVIAEQFGTLEALYPGRIDLGLGRAPGTDQLTLRALRRDPLASEHFQQDVLELQAWLGPVREGQRIEAVPGSNANVPIWILGSSLYGAQMAAAYGFPFGFASHFAPQMLDQALAMYRAGFRPSTQQPRPYALIGVNIIAAETDGEARYLATSQQMSFANLVRGERRLTQPPIDDIDTYWTPQEKAQASHMLNFSIVGSRDTVRRGLIALIARTQADELMVVSDTYDQDRRRRSLEIIAEVMATLKTAAGAPA
jgi:luciferase family oxidoreductase group 1